MDVNEEISRLRKIIEAYESYQENVEYALDKIGMNNFRIEQAEEELNKKLSVLRMPNINHT